MVVGVANHLVADRVGDPGVVGDGDDLVVVDLRVESLERLHVARPLMSTSASARKAALSPTANPSPVITMSNGRFDAWSETVPSM
jgi:hypothetical protein